MLSCREVEPLLAPYVDGAAGAGERAQVDEHIAACAACRAIAAGQQAARKAIAGCRESLRGCASTRLRARCAAHRASRSAGHVPSRVAALARRRWVPLSLAATLLLAISGVFLYSFTNQVEALAAQLALDHMKCFQVGSLTPGDPHPAADGWAATYGWPVQVPASAAAHDLEFLTLRRCFVTDGRAAHMMYRWRGQPLSVFVLPVGLRDPVARRLVDTLSNHHAAFWTSGDRTYVVVARGEPSDMDRMVGYVRAHAK